MSESARGQRFSNIFKGRSLLIIFIGLSGFISLNACSEFNYILHTAGGHMEVMAERKSISDLLDNQKTPEELRTRLKNIAWIRHFASDRLDLPENGSYQSYVALDRPYVVWNVVATAELSLEPLEWCFPIAGCINYRGYFKLGKAQDFSEHLQEEGYDTIVSGVPAYSTLKWFNDPALSTFSRWPTSSVARLIFHELAHQKLYVVDDSAFNESFATTVGLAGVRLWLESFGSEKEKDEYNQRLKHERQFIELIKGTRQELETIYDSSLPDQQKREQKKFVFLDLRKQYQALRESWNGYSGYDPWFKTLNNAKFASVNTYHRWVPAFKLIMEEEGNDFPSFYRRCEAISRLPREKRDALLEVLVARSQQREQDSPTATDRVEKL